MAHAGMADVVVAVPIASVVTDDDTTSREP
jgi:hypothetical protein